jgi:acyl-coenzyme A thioesterase PaaI-like protein
MVQAELVDDHVAYMFCWQLVSFGQVVGTQELNCGFSRKKVKHGTVAVAE